MQECCVRGFQWTDTPVGKEEKLCDNNVYVTGTNENVAIMIIHDALGWTFVNNRLLADHYAREVNATVYLPDFFGGEVLPADILRDMSRIRELDMKGFLKRNTKDIREPEISACAREIRARYERIGVIGFCFGGWAVFRLGSKLNSPSIVDCISTAHPSALEEHEIESVNVPVQILAPENDIVFTSELKEFANRVIPTLGVPYDYQHFPGVTHGFASRGNMDDKEELKAMVRAKDCAVGWFRHWLHVD
ncbi:Alpha/Beta hydrolase protein [Bisporella sp. PMI_857]|nr:Alpha/Beta hydrolase protein [Bisporella sp. PMI_857]